MIDNAAHDILVQAASKVSWNEETMLVIATRFIAGLGGDDPTVMEKLEAYLNEQVAEESAEHAMEQVQSRAAAPPAAKKTAARSPRSKPRATSASPRPRRRR